MITDLLKIFGFNKQTTLKEILSKTKIDTDQRHLIRLPESLAVRSKPIHFIDATNKEIDKKLGLIHNPQVRTVYPEKDLSFNQRTAALSRNLKKGLPKLKKTA